MINSVVLMGRLTADPELKKTTSGKSVIKFTVAVERRFNRNETDFLEVVAWQKTAEFVSQYFRKGSMIAVQGEVQARSYEDNNGNKRKAVEIIAEQVSFCGSKGENAAKADSDYLEIPEVADEDLPF